MTKEKQIYKNVMEILVDEEIEYQLVHNKTINTTVKDYINPIEVATFALNRLPSLYASSAEGIQKQKRRAIIKYKKDITKAVIQGFAAVERDPLRRSTPLPSEREDIISDARKSLTQLDETVPKEELSLIVEFMENFLNKIQTEEITAVEIIKLYYLLDFYWEEDGEGLMQNKAIRWYG
ncbi:late competence development ComFB family protein [Cyanobacterium stanieri LEGE 03274]|uniref:Late competence development ComFB family protein n=1 Tax=Cyanobacterium stanieri LEGE 03274 TaxID=1828756 RepID=A0ABR9V2F0_9CHRO|nr:late competence development ComFB family protein [Cyanobacterium stanieri]MBE9222050.1 late competence development ComFB family protein [Cyanobacterium stanieri LEGE 03274]